MTYIFNWNYVQTRKKWFSRLDLFRLNQTAECIDYVFFFSFLSSEYCFQCVNICVCFLCECVFIWICLENEINNAFSCCLLIQFYCWSFISCTNLCLCLEFEILIPFSLFSFCKFFSNFSYFDHIHLLLFLSYSLACSFSIVTYYLKWIICFFFFCFFFSVPILFTHYLLLESIK